MIIVKMKRLVMFALLICLLLLPAECKFSSNNRFIQTGTARLTF